MIYDLISYILIVCLLGATVFKSAKVFNIDVSKWNTGVATEMEASE